VLRSPLLTLGLIWTAIHPGVWLGEMRLAREGPLAAVQVVLLRLDPSAIRFSLHQATRDEGTRNAWTIDSLPDGAIAGFNAGQFSGVSPWGWLVRGGVESRPAGTGRLVMTFAIGADGVPVLLNEAERNALATTPLLAFQSYPALLVGNGESPPEFASPGRGVDLAHRDSRVAIGITREGQVIVALTRYAALGPMAETFPYGPTVGEMSEFMRSLGCRRAMLLDGGLSGQLAIRRADGTMARWSNWRAVPLGMVVTSNPSQIREP